MTVLRHPLTTALLLTVLGVIAKAHAMSEAGGSRPEITVVDPEAGRPPIKNWTMRDYGAFPQIWAARSDTQGRLYFGNRDGVLTYDGQQWGRLEARGAVFIRGIDFDAQGRLYWAGVDDLGYFERNALGEWGPAVSLRDQLPPGHRMLGNVHNVFALPEGVFFQAEKRILRWRDGKFHVWDRALPTNTFLYRAGDTLYVHRLGDVLARIVGDEIVPVSAAPAIRENRLASVTPWDEGALMLAWPRHGIAIFRDGRLTPWSDAADAWLRSVVIIGIRLLPQNRVAVLTEQSGVGLFDRTGNLERVIDTEAGLFNAIVRDIHADGENGLWFATNHGVAHVDALTGYTLFDSLNGLGRSTARAVRRHAGQIHVATAEGVFRLLPAAGGRMARFERVPGTEIDALALYSHPSGLLYGTRESLQLLPADGSAPQKIVNRAVFCLLPRPGRPDELWMGAADGIHPLRWDGTGWRLGARLPGETSESRTIVELPDGSVWTSTPTRGLFRWASPLSAPAAPPEQFFERAGLGPGHGWCRIVGWRDQLIVSNQHGLHRWDAAAGAFTPLPRRGLLGEPGSSSFNIEGGDPGYLWTFFGTNRRTARVTRLAPDGTPEALPHTIGQQLGDIETLWRERVGERELLWIGGTYGLMRVDLTDVFQPAEPFAASITQVISRHTPSIRDEQRAWPHGRADLEFRFAAPRYRDGAHLAFQTLLSGYETEWTSWSPDARRTFTNLEAGAYELRVRARDADGQVGAEAALPFRILPAWWETRWAYAGYGALALLGVYALMRWRVQASEQARRRLQHLVAERTGQLAESQQRLLLAKEAAETANRAKSVFLSSMSHELRTPLNSVLGYAQILRRSPTLDPTARQQLGVIQQSGDHLLHLINEVLDLAKVEAGRLELRAEPFSLADHVREIAALFTLRATEKGLELKLPDAAGLLPRLVVGDAHRLRQILVNLLANALKFTATGSVTWTITPGAEPGKMIFSVADTGPGIAPEEQARIFEAFYQSSHTQAAALQGTGLGLAISAQLVQLMGGILRLESRVGAGSRFFFEIALPGVVNEKLRAMAPSAASTVAGYEGRRRRLLVVDDEKTNRTILLEMLAPLGFALAEAQNAAEARALVRQQAPDLVLLDLRMPGEDGFTLAREWRDHGALLGAKVLALSASVLPEQQAAAISAGCDAFMAKPFREEHLLEVIGSLLQLTWRHAPAPAGPAETSIPAQDDAVVETPVWETGILRRLLQLAEHGDALRMREELAGLARRGAAWARAVAPWEKLADAYQMQALSQAVESKLRESISQ